MGDLRLPECDGGEGRVVVHGNKLMDNLGD